MKEQYAKFNIEETDISQEAEDKNINRQQIYAALVRHGLMEYDQQGQRVFDIENLQNLRINSVNGTRKHLNVLDYIEALDEQQGLSKSEVERAGAKAAARPVITLPKDIQDMVSGSYSSRANKALTQPWKITPQFHFWTSPYNLPSGETTNFSEMAVAEELFGHLQAKRTKEGSLFIRDPETGEESKFSVVKFREMAGINPGNNPREGRAFSFYGNTYEYAEKYLPNLIRAGLLKKEDFKVMGNRSTAEIFNINERTVTPTQPYATFTVRLGQTAKYYIGRENARVVLLDKETAAVVDTIHGKEVPRYTFRLLDEKESEDHYQQAMQRMEKRGKKVSHAKLSQYISVGEKEMKDRRQAYDITVYAPQRADESSEDYARRAAQLNDIAFVRGSVHKLFTEAGIGIHNLPWGEQLQVADAILEEKDRNRLVAFAKKFGLEGVRALSTLDYNDNLKNVIFNIADRLPEETAREIFRNLSALKSQAKNIAAVFKNSEVTQIESLKGKNKTAFTEQITEAIVRRGKDMLYTAQALAKIGKAEAGAFGNRVIKLNNPQEVPKALRIYADSLEKLNDLVSPDKRQRHEFSLLSVADSQVPEIYEFAVKNKENGGIGYLSVQLRERGAAIGQHNQELEFDGEARINLLFSSQMIGRNIGEPSRQQALSLRLDREGKQREGDQIIDNDPTRDEGGLSLEIGGFAQNSDVSDSAVVGRVASIGNALATAAEKQNQKKFPQFYHNRESFANELGEAETFAEIVRFVRGKIRQNYIKDHPAASEFRTS